MNASDVETASDVSDRVVRDLELLAQRLDDARAFTDPAACGEPSCEDLRRITQEIVTAERSPGDVRGRRSGPS